MSDGRISRRRLLALAGGGTLAGWTGPAADLLAAPLHKRRRRRRRRAAPPPLPRVNGAINVQPIGRFGPDQEPRDLKIFPEIVDLQMRALYELGFDSVRMTFSFAFEGDKLLESLPYLRAARALGIDVLALIGQFGYHHDLARALADRSRRERVLDGYLELLTQPVQRAASTIESTGRLGVQLLNEPTNFLGVPPSAYVSRFLAPAYAHLKSRAPEVPVLSAAPVGEKIGVLRFHEMLGAGLEDHCDIVALHVYNPEILERLADLTGKRIWITESGALGPENHLGWVKSFFPSIRSAMPTVERIFFFELWDLYPGAFRILDIAERPGRGISSEVESRELHEALTRRVATAAGQGPHARYEDLIPDITAYFPTAEDRDRIERLIRS